VKHIAVLNWRAQNFSDDCHRQRRRVLVDQIHIPNTISKEDERNEMKKFILHGKPSSSHYFLHALQQDYIKLGKPHFRQSATKADHRLARNTSSSDFPPLIPIRIFNRLSGFTRQFDVTINFTRFSLHWLSICNHLFHDDATYNWTE
jgi:hypothetical protein